MIAVSPRSVQGRRFSNIVDQAFWWQREAMLFLRHRSRGLSLQDYRAIRKIVDGSLHKGIFQERPAIE